MFSLFKKSITGTEILAGHTDTHCHILPGVDDGTQHMSDALATLKFYEDNGLKRLFFTPHIAQSLHENTPENLRKRLEEFKAEYKGNIELRLGAEYMMDEEFSKKVERGDELLCASPGTILVETTAGHKPWEMEETLFELQQKGYTVMLAHPERYVYMEEEDYERLKDKDILFQMNILSLDGTYGKHAFNKAKKLLKKGMYDFCGSDWHKKGYHIPHFSEKSFSSSSIKEIAELLKKNDTLK